MACAPSENSDQPGHMHSLIIVFAVRMKKAWALSYPLSTQLRLLSGWADAQADLCLRWAHMPFCWIVVRWLSCNLVNEIQYLIEVIQLKVYKLCFSAKITKCFDYFEPSLSWNNIDTDNIGDMQVHLALHCFSPRWV